MSLVFGLGLSESVSFHLNILFILGLEIIDGLFDGVFFACPGVEILKLNSDTFVRVATRGLVESISTLQSFSLVGAGNLALCWTTPRFPYVVVCDEINHKEMDFCIYIYFVLL